MQTRSKAVNRKKGSRLTNLYEAIKDPKPEDIIPLGEVRDRVMALVIVGTLLVLVSLMDVVLMEHNTIRFWMIDLLLVTVAWQFGVLPATVTLGGGYSYREVVNRFLDGDFLFKFSAVTSLCVVLLLVGFPLRQPRETFITYAAVIILYSSVESMRKLVTASINPGEGRKWEGRSFRSKVLRLLAKPSLVGLILLVAVVVGLYMLPHLGAGPGDADPFLFWLVLVVGRTLSVGLLALWVFFQKRHGAMTSVLLEHVWKTSEKDGAPIS